MRASLAARAEDVIPSLSGDLQTLTFTIGQYDGHFTVIAITDTFRDDLRRVVREWDMADEAIAKAEQTESLLIP